MPIVKRNAGASFWAFEMRKVKILESWRAITTVSMKNREYGNEIIDM